MSKLWKVAIVKDSSKPMLGLHGLHTAFRGLPHVEVVAHVDSNSENLEHKLAQTQAKRHYATLPEMLANEEPDIVVLCSRHPGDHLEQIRQVVAKGCHIYCEKPVCVCLDEADEITRIVERAGIELAMAHPARHDLGYRMMKRMIESGTIGTPLSMHGRGKCDHRGGGEDLIVLGTHILDLMAFFLGAPKSVTAEVRLDGRPAVLGDSTETVEPIGPALGDEVCATFEFPNAVSATFESRKGLFVPGQSEPQMGLQVIGTEGSLSLRFDDGGSQPLLFSRQSGTPETITDFESVDLSEERAIPGAEPLDGSLCGQPNVPRAPWFLAANRYAAWDLIQAIEAGRRPVSNIYTARVVVEMIQGVYAAHLSQGSVNFPLTNRQHPLSGN